MIDLEFNILTQFNTDIRLFAHRTHKGGRLFHSLSNSKRIYRPFLKIQNQETVEIDISSSQPLLLVKYYDKYAGQYRNLPCERERYYDLVKQGKLYHAINDKLSEMHGPLFDFENEEHYSFFKERVFSEILYCPNGTRNRLLWDAFKKLFPILSKILIAEKETPRGRRIDI